MISKFTKEKVLSCCDNPDINLTENIGRMEVEMRCLNCNEFYIVISGMPIVDYWNDMIIKRNQ